MARPSKYDTEIKDKLLLVQGWARDGLSMEQIAKNIGIHVATLYEWKIKYPEFDEAIKKGKEVVDMEVENALLKSALGYNYEETKQIIEKDDNGKDKKRIEKTIKHVAGSNAAQIFWLINRMPGKWRDKKKIEMEGHLQVKDNIEKMSDEELENEIKKCTQDE